jgi:cytochrome c oxidase assembly protein subunit 15
VDLAATAERERGRPGGALASFEKLAAAAAAATFVLILVGGVVRLDDAGLGCGAAGSGLHGWPLCGGRIVPDARVHPVVEYTHRFLAAVVVLLVAALLWQALRRLRGERLLVRGSALAALLVLAQAVLGGLTVEHGLRTALVAAHLGMAMLLLGTLVALAAAARPARVSPARPRGRPRVLAAAACVLLLATIVAGGVIAGTEHRGVPGGIEGAHLACGRSFPTCNGALLPYGERELVDIQLVHRTLMLAAAAAIAAFAFALLRRRLARRLAIGLLAALAAQVLLGAANVWLGEHAGLILAHLALATALWTLTVAAAATSSLRP